MEKKERKDARIGLRIPAPLLEELRSVAGGRGISDVAQEALEQWVKERRKAA